MNKKIKMLVHLHLFYPEQTDYFVNKLKNINSCEWDLFITSCEDDNIPKNKFLKINPRTKFIKIKNTGYDIYPFLVVLKSVDLNNYDYILKLHTKRKIAQYIPYVPYKAKNYDWRNTLVSALIGSQKIFRSNLQKLELTPEIGLICSKDYLLAIEKYSTTADKVGLTALKKELNISSNYPYFIAGTMFLARATCLQKLSKLNIDKLDFQQSQASGISGSLAHIYERIFCILVDDEGYKVYLIKNKFIKLKSYFKYSLLKQIFSIKNSNNKTHKIFTILGVKLSIKLHKINRRQK